MLIVGELINASRQAIQGAIEGRDAAAIQRVAREQHEAGADYIDVNAGVFVGEEAGHLTWLVQTVQQAVDAPCCIDSPDPAAVEAALKVHRGTAMVNSISLERERFDRLVPLLAGTELRVVALCMSDEGMPATSDQRVRIAHGLVDRLVRHNVRPGNIYVDPVVQPVSTDHEVGAAFLDAVARIRAEIPDVHVICGLSNISYGLPERKLVNQTFAVMAVARGLDALIVNPLDRRMMAGLRAALVLAGQDPYCMGYLEAFREGRLAGV